MQRKLAWIGDIYIYRKRKCQEYVKLKWGVKMEQTNVFIVDFSFKMYVEIDRYHKLY